MAAPDLLEIVYIDVRLISSGQLSHDILAEKGIHDLLIRVHVLARTATDAWITNA